MKTRILVFSVLALAACDQQAGPAGKNSALGVSIDDPGTVTAPDAGVAPDDPPEAVHNTVLQTCALAAEDLQAYPLGEVDNFDSCTFSFSTQFPDLNGYATAAAADPNADPGAVAISQELHCTAADGRALDLSLVVSSSQADHVATFTNSDGTVDVPSDLAGLYVQRAIYVCGQVGKLGVELD